MKEKVKKILEWFKYHDKNMTNKQIEKLEEICEILKIKINYRN